MPAAAAPADPPVLSKAGRTACHAARDAYNACAAKHGPEPSAGTATRVPAQCEKLRAAYEAACPKSWVSI